MGKNFGRQGNGTARTHPATQEITAINRVGKLWVPNKDGPQLNPKQNTAAIDRGPHQSALEPEAIAHLKWRCMIR